MKKFINILTQIGLIIWQLPQVLVALIMMPFLGKLRLVEYRDYCWAFEASNMSGGISLGCFIFLSKYSAKSKTTIAHEYGHSGGDNALAASESEEHGEHMTDNAAAARDVRAKLTE